MNKLIKKAVKITLPVMAGYIFLGIAFGMLLQKAGYHFIWAFLISLLVYAGSMQFVLVKILSSGAAFGVTGLLQIIVTTFLINSRHIFYGLSFIEKYKGTGRKKPYLIFSLTDETYSLLCTAEHEDKKEEKTLFFLVSLLDQCYWIIGSIIGAVAVNFIKIDTTGIEFSMTALFTVTFVEQWLTTKSKLPAVIGIICGVLSLLIFGPDNFLFPAMIITMLLLIGLKRKIEPDLDAVLKEMPNNMEKLELADLPEQREPIIGRAEEE